MDKAQLGETAYDYIEIAVSNGVANGSIISDVESFRGRTRTADTDSGYSPEVMKRGVPARMTMTSPLAANITAGDSTAGLTGNDGDIKMISDDPKDL